MRMTQNIKVPDDPDVLAWDPSWRRLYVAAESGALTGYVLEGNTCVHLVRFALRTRTRCRSIREHT